MIINGDFEDFSAKHCKQSWCLLTNTEAIKPWTVTSSYKTFELDNTPWKAASGDWSMDLNSDKPFTIGQNVSLEVGKSYELRFSLNHNNCEVAQKTGFARISGAPDQVFSRSQALHGNQWQIISVPFVATQTLTLIELGSTTAQSCGPVIDDVELNLVEVAKPISVGRNVRKCNK